MQLVPCLFRTPINETNTQFIFFNMAPKHNGPHSHVLWHAYHTLQA